MAKNAETIITAYKQADKDATEFLCYIESISDPRQLNNCKLPSLVGNLENKDSAVAAKYISCASILGGSVASAVGTSISTSLLASGAMFGGGALTVGGIGMSMITGLNLFLIPIVGVPLAMKLLADAKVKKYTKENKVLLKQKQKRMQLCKEKLVRWLNDLQHQANGVDEKLKEEVTKQFSEYKEKTKKFSKAVSIQIDDCLNTNANKRIQQYNEVILSQYKLQKDLEEKVNFLFEEYNNLLAKKSELERQVNCLIKLLNAMGCPAAVINQALSESEG